MRANRSIHKWIFVGAGGVFVCSILTLFVQHRTTWFGSYAGGGSEDQGVAAATSGKLSELETRQVRDMVARLADSSLAGDAAIQLRRHIETVVRQEPAKAAATMIVALESLASRFEKLDLEPQRFGVGLTASVLEWFAAHPETPGTRLLIPTREILDAAFSDSATELHGVALQAVVHFWRWAPEKTDDPTVHKSVALLRTKLHDRCVSMLHSPEESVRTHAVAALAAFPDATAAAQCIVLLEDEKESVPVRRTVLLALSERPEAMASETVIGFLNHDSFDLRRTAELVLRSRGLSGEEIALATRATHPSPLVRSQVPWHVLQSTVVDQLVWLHHLSWDQEAAVRKEAVRALATLANQEARNRVGEIAEQDPEPEIRTLAQSLLKGSDAAAAETPGGAPVTLPVIQTPAAN